MATNLENARISAGLALKNLLHALPEGATVKREHTEKTGSRVAKMFEQFFEGCFQDPMRILAGGFLSQADEMIYVNNISFVSTCAHHVLPFLGRVHFAYIPKGTIVGLSKIPRLVECFARRPQIQEEFTEQIVDTFMKAIHPRGCGVVVEAYHMCMSIRGIEKEEAYTMTTGLRGIFKSRPTVKQEFLDGVNSSRKGNLWP